MDLNTLPTSHLIMLIKLHTQEKYRPLLIGTNPLTEDEISTARKLIRARNRKAFLARKY